MEEVHRLGHYTPQYGLGSLVKDQDTLVRPLTWIKSYERYKNKELLMRGMKTQPVLLRKTKIRLVKSLKA